MGGWKSTARCGRRVCSGLNLGSGAPPGRLGALFLQRWVEAELEGWTDGLCGMWRRVSSPYLRRTKRGDEMREPRALVD